MRDEIDVQNELRGLLLAGLLKGGVRRVGHSSEDFHAAFATDIPEIEDFDSLFYDMLLWLKAEGYVRFETVYDGTNGETCVAGLQATSKAIKLLDQQVPDTGASARELLRPTGNTGLDAENYGKIGSFFGGFVGGFAASVGGG